MNLLVMEDMDNPWEQSSSELIEMESDCDEVLVLPSLDDLDDETLQSTEADSEPTEVPYLFNVSPLTSQDENIVANQNIEGSFENKTLTKVDDSVQEHDDDKSDKRNNCDNELNIVESDKSELKKVDSPLESLETLDDVEMVILGHCDINDSEALKIEENNNSDTEHSHFDSDLMIVCD